MADGQVGGSSGGDCLERRHESSHPLSTFSEMLPCKWILETGPEAGQNAWYGRRVGITRIRSPRELCRRLPWVMGDRRWRWLVRGRRSWALVAPDVRSCPGFSDWTISLLVGGTGLLPRLADELKEPLALTLPGLIDFHRGTTTAAGLPRWLTT